MNAAIPLSETDTHVLFIEHDAIFLFDKETNSELWRTSFYDGPNIGFLGLINDWAIAGGGEQLLIWKNKELKFIRDPDLVRIHDIRQVGDDEVEILTDPWEERSAIWTFNVMTEEKVKLRDFPDYREKEYTEHVEW